MKKKKFAMFVHEIKMSKTRMFLLPKCECANVLQFFVIFAEITNSNLKIGANAIHNTRQCCI